MNRLIIPIFGFDTSQQGRSALIAEVAGHLSALKGFPSIRYCHFAEFQQAGSLDFGFAQPYLVGRTGDGTKLRSSKPTGDGFHCPTGFPRFHPGSTPGAGVRKAQDHGSLFSENSGTS